MNVYLTDRDVEFLQQVKTFLNQTMNLKMTVIGRKLYMEKISSVDEASLRCLCYMIHELWRERK